MRTLMLALSLLGCRAPDTTDPRPPPETVPTPTPTPTEPVLSHRTEVAIEEAVETGLAISEATGASVAIWLEGEVVYAQGFGTAHPDLDQPVTPDTRFQIGSDTKKLTAMLVLRAVERGELSLDDTVDDLLPDLELALSPDWDDTTTMHDLLSHQGGLYDYIPWDDDPTDAALSERAYDVLAPGGFAMAPAGEFFNYSNPNFSIAALALEQATGRTWAELLTDDLITPLGLTGTVPRMADLPADSWATGNGYFAFDDPTPFDPWDAVEYAYGTVEHEDELDNGFTRPAGLAWSTASDLARVAGFLVDGDAAVLEDSLRELVAAPHATVYPGLPDEGNYGYGLYTYPDLRIGVDSFDVPLWVHGGNTLSMTSTFVVLPEQRFALVVLSNGYLDDFSDVVAASIPKVVELPEGTPIPALPPGDAAAFVGAWADASGTLGPLEVVLDGTRLDVTLSGMDARRVSYSSNLVLLAEDVGLITVGGVGYDLTAIDGPSGPGHWLRNRLFVVERDAPFAAARARGPATGGDWPRTDPIPRNRFPAARE